MIFSCKTKCNKIKTRTIPKGRFEPNFQADLFLYIEFKLHALVSVKQFLRSLYITLVNVYIGKVERYRFQGKIYLSVRLAKRNVLFFRPPRNAKRPGFLLGVSCFFFIIFQTFKSNFTLSSPSSSSLVRSILFSYMWMFPRFKIMFFRGKSICRAIR